MENNTFAPIDEMTSEFILEIKEDLAGLEPDLLAMEEAGGKVSEDLINHAFRAIHSIKGGAGFIQFTSLTRLAHAMENVFMHVREGKLNITSEIVDHLLAGFDMMKTMVEHIRSKDDIRYEPKEFEFQTILKGLMMPSPGVQPGETDPTEDPMKEPAVLVPEESNVHFQGRSFEVNRLDLEPLISNQRFIFAALFKPGIDFVQKDRLFSEVLEDIENIGELLFSNFNGDIPVTGGSSGPDDIFCVIGTILDKVFLAEVLEIDSNRIVSLEQQKKNELKKAVSDVTQPLYMQERDGSLDDLNEKSEQSSASLFVQDHTDSSVRINLSRLSALMNRAGELVLTRNQMKPFLEKFASQSPELDAMYQNLDLVTTDIQETVMQMRMQPIRDLLGKYKRVIRDMSRKLGKKVDYSFIGGEVELDRTVLEALANPFVHLIRNCVDHGIEAPDERIRAGKKESGSIQVKVCHQAGQVHIAIIDDGIGIDPDIIADRAVAQNRIPREHVAEMSKSEKLDLIFLPGLSTSDHITDMSGRGVGMDVVKNSIEKLGGHIHVESMPRQGTHIRLVIPLTLAIMSAIIVETAHSRFAVPQISIKEVLHVEPGEIRSRVENWGGSEVLRLRERFIPVIRLRNVLDLDAYIPDPIGGQPLKERRKRIADRRSRIGQHQQSPEQRGQGKMERRKTDWGNTYVIVLKHETHIFGLCVDTVHDIEEIVVEPLSSPIKQCQCFSGSTIIGDGRIVLILDAAGLAARADLRFEKVNDLAQQIYPTDDIRQGRKEWLVFCGAPNEYFALELHQLSRLKEIKRSEIHTSGCSKFFQYDGKLLPLLSLSDALPVSPIDLEEDPVFVVMVKHPTVQMGILSAGIEDVFSASGAIQDEADSGKGGGKFIWKGKMVQALDMDGLISIMDHESYTGSKRGI